MREHFINNNVSTRMAKFHTLRFSQNKGHASQTSGQKACSFLRKRIQQHSVCWHLCPPVMSPCYPVAITDSTFKTPALSSYLLKDNRVNYTGVNLTLWVMRSKISWPGQSVGCRGKENLSAPKQGENRLATLFYAFVHSLGVLFWCFA